jgi:4-amino-4-deoxy-L-arabinose transferase-like glycosyltransferase
VVTSTTKAYGRTLLLPILWLLAVTVPHLEQGDFRRDTGRYAAVGLYMWSGGSFLQPHLNPETPYFNKPPLALWIHGLCLRLFGVHLTVARLPSIVAALGVVCLSVLTARQIGSNAEALTSGVVLALSYEFFRRTREISLDFWQLFFLLLAAFLVVRAAKRNKKGLLIAAGLPIGLALLCKPLVGLGAIPIFAIWLWLLRNARQWRWLLFGTVPVALLVALPWHLYMWQQFGDQFTHKYFHEETLNRAKGLLGSESPLYYLRILASTYWPWLMAVGYAIYFRSSKPARKPERDLVLLGGSWVVLTLLLLSFFPGKQVNYALPVYPMLSWVAAAGLCRIPWHPLRDWYRRRLAGAATAAVLVLLTMSLAPIKFQRPPDQDWAALFRWLDQHAIPPENVSQRDLDYDDICYFYLKRGKWLPNAAMDPSMKSGAKQPEFVLKRVSGNQLVGPQSPTFRSGDLTLYALHQLNN